MFTIFCRFRKVRFKRYRPQLKWNQAVLLLKQWRRLLLTSFKLSLKYHLYKPLKWRLIYWCKTLLFTIFCGFRKVRFQRYRPELKWNQGVFLLKQWRRLLQTSFKLSFKYHLYKPQKWRLIYAAKDWCSQFFADSAKYVSNATVHSWNGINPFLHSSNDVVFF